MKPESVGEGCCESEILVGSWEFDLSLEGADPTSDGCLRGRGGGEEEMATGGSKGGTLLAPTAADLFGGAGGGGEVSADSEGLEGSGLAWTLGSGGGAR